MIACATLKVYWHRSQCAMLSSFGDRSQGYLANGLRQLLDSYVSGHELLQHL